MQTCCANGCNNSQQWWDLHAKTCNGICKRTQHVTSNNVASVWGGLTTNDLQLINYIKLLITFLSSSLSGYFFICFSFSVRCHKCREFGYVSAQCPNQRGGRMEAVPEQNQQRRNRCNREKHPCSEQFLFHYATLKDVLGLFPFVRTDRPATPFLSL